MSIFGDNGAQDTIKKALAGINNIPVPTAQSMQVQLQQYVQAGILTPEEAQYYAQNPTEFAKIQINPKGEQAQVQAIDALLAKGKAGGMDDQEQNALQETIRALDTQDRGQRGAVLQDAAQRGALTSGMTTAAELEANQTGAANANQRALQSRADASSRALSALTTAGGMGATLQGQDWKQEAEKASAADAINAFNASQQNQTAQFNTANKNAAKAANLSNAQSVGNANVAEENANRTRNADLIQKNFDNQLQKATAASGVAQGLGGVQAGEAAQDASFVGNLIGTGATAIGSAYGGPGAAPAMKQKPTTGTTAVAAHGGVMGPDNEIHAYLNGGKVPGRAPVAGDSPQNDVAPALLSPGEAVLPRSVVNAPDDRVLSFLHRMRGQPPKVDPRHVATVIQALHQLQGV